MNEQEMQFADPEWKPNGQGQQTYVPQPVNKDGLASNQEQAVSLSQPPLQEPAGGYRGYAGTPPMYRPAEAPVYVPQQGQPPRAQRRRRAGPLFWIILVIIILSMVGGGMHRGSAIPGVSVPLKMITSNQTYAVSSQATVVINDTSGTVHIHSGDAGKITVTTQKNAAGDPNQLQVDQQMDKQSNTLTINVPQDGANSGPTESVDIEVTVPQNTALQVVNDQGDINVDGLSGQMNLTSNGGSITLNNDQLSNNSSIRAGDGQIDMSNGSISGSYDINSNGGSIDMTQETLSGQGRGNVISQSGSVTFQGTLDRNGTYLFESQSNSVDVTLPADANARVNLPQNATNEFGSTSIGSGTQSTVTLKTDTGSVSLHKQ